MTVVNVKPYEAYRAFHLYPCTVYQMESRGVLPKRPRGKVTAEWLAALLVWHESARGTVPPEAAKLVKTVKARERDGHDRQS